MSFNFPKPSSAEASKFIPEQLVKLANQQPDKSIPLPTVDRVLEAIQQNRANEVTELEWIYCIHAKQQWDDKSPHLELETSQLIWKVAINNNWLRHQLLWRLALYYGGNKDELATSLAISFSVLANSPTVNQLLPVKIMQAVVSNNSGLKLAKIACEENFTRNKFLNHIQNDLPAWIPQFSQFTECISSYFCTIDSPYEQQVNWFLRCLDEMSSEKQVNAVNHLLINVSKEVASNHPQLVEWMRKNYHRNKDNWNRLSDEAREKLREWIGAVNYTDFQNFVELILPNISVPKQVRQLKARQKFWANYSNSLQQLRVLSPKKSLNAIVSQLTINIDVLEEDASDATEVCIFDFGECLIVEFFRGKGSETRLFDNNHRNQQILFSESNLSVKRIRALGGKAHDHVLCWQWACEKWLRRENILANKDTQCFIGLKPQYGNFDFNAGLPQPSPDKLQQRESQLITWKKSISKLEQEAQDFCR